MSHIVLFGSARSEGATKKAVDQVFEGRNYRFVDLRSLHIGPFDYNYEANKDDDFLPLVKEMLLYDTIVLASPVYWYSVSSYMKTFVDRWSDLFVYHRDLADRLKGKQLFLLTSFGSKSPLGCVGFEEPIKQTCHYMNIDYRGCYYQHPEADFVKSLGFPSLEEFQSQLFL
jgi:multimeric flavodoxin WrbA